MKKILITGSDGLLGSQLCRDFLKIGMNVVGIDNQKKYGKVDLDYKHHKNFTFIKGDCTDYKLMKSISCNCDYLISNAALVSGIKMMNFKPYDFYKKNEEISDIAIRTALELKKRKKNFKFIFISSSMVYEKNKKKYSSEDDTKSISYPENFYSFQKLSTERKIISANVQENLNYVIIRPFNIVGNGDYYLFEKSSHVIPDIIRKINKNSKVINIYGNGKQSR
ncbi:NAD(P)-dependent oxidoreductase, partial [Pelagibacteraceae bacterium]|nr:NAD(P)-dependent oxidoreductase [Pelagibacteraceae bacterium]